MQRNSYRMDAITETKAAIMQAARAVESETERDWKPEPTYLVGSVCRMPVIPIENSAAERRDVERARSRPTVRPTDIGRAIPSETMSSMCCSEEKNKGPFGGVCDEEYRRAFLLLSILCQILLTYKYAYF